MVKSFTIKKDSILKSFFFFFLVTGYLNTVLRISPDSDVTLFRVLLPVAFCIFCIVFRRFALQCSVLLAVLLVYGGVCSYFISRFQNFNFIYYLHYASVVFISFLTFALARRFGVQSVFNHLRAVYILMICLAVFQFITDFQFPNTEYLGTINIYYWVDNDFAAALAAFIPFLLFTQDHKTTNKCLAALGIAIIAYNGSRIALLSIIFFLLFSSLDRLKWLGHLTALLVGIGLFLYFKDYKLGGDTLTQLLMEPFRHITSLTPYDKGGSIYDRTDALIFGIKELISTGGLGVGPGNATAMFQLPEYSLLSAESMHNFIAQIFVEYGWLMLITIIYFIAMTYNHRRRAGIPKRKDRILYIYMLTAALASLSQSEGIFSNYYFFVSFFTSISYFGNTLYAAAKYSTRETATIA